MGKLLYDVVRETVNGTSDKLRIRSEVDSAIVLRIDNVAEYYLQSEKDIWDIQQDFPNLAPPFPAFWLEYKMPSMVHADGVQASSGGAGWHIGLLCMAHDVDRDGARWALQILMFTASPQMKMQEPFVEWQIVVDADGHPMMYKNGYLYQSVEAAYVKRLEAVVGQENVMRVVEPLAAGYLFGGLLAISFMHCKNVELEEHEPPKLPMTKKRAQHPPRTKFYTLNIKPMQRILEDEGHASKTGLKLALHICRGHFKDFSKGAGLFGRHKGLYWWDSQVRGDRKYGEVIKDYAVKPPDETT